MQALGSWHPVSSSTLRGMACSPTRPANVLGLQVGFRVWGLWFRDPQNWGYLIGGPHNKDHSILGSILGSPILGNYQVCLWPKGQLSIPLFFKWNCVTEI